MSFGTFPIPLAVHYCGCFEGDVDHLQPLQMKILKYLGQ